MFFLYLFVFVGFLDIIKLIFKKSNVYINIKERFMGRILLYLVCVINYLFIIKFLIDNGVDINLIINFRKFLLYIASINKVFEIVILLLRNEVNVNIMSIGNKIVLYNVIEVG